MLFVYLPACGAAVSDLLHGTGHTTITSQVVEEHKPAIEIDSLQDIVCDENSKEIVKALVLEECVVLISDKGVSLQKMLVILPLEQNFISLVWITDCIQHITIALRVDALLECLNAYTKVNLVGCYVLRYVWQVCALK